MPLHNLFDSSLKVLAIVVELNKTLNVEGKQFLGGSSCNEIDNLVDNWSIFRYSKVYNNTFNYPFCDSLSDTSSS